MTNHILVADDDPNTRNLVAAVLESEEYRVTTASDGREALDAIAQEPPKILFLDMNMPVLDGWGVARALHNQGQDVPIVVMTAEDNAYQCCREVGARTCLPKPFDIDAVLEAAAEISAADLET